MLLERAQISCGNVNVFKVTQLVLNKCTVIVLIQNFMQQYYIQCGLYPTIFCKFLVMLESNAS